MCIIVDANRMGTFLADPVREDVAPIHRWLEKRSGTLVYSTGGKFESEIGATSRRKLLSYVQAGRAKLVDAADFDEDEQRLNNNAVLRSDDPHVLALARFSGARVLFTADGDLRDDFKDKRFIDNPRGKIYSGKQNASLLTQSTCRRQR